MLIDIGLLLIVIFGFYRGYSKGIIHTVFSMIGWLLGLALAFKLTTVLSPKVGEWLQVRADWLPVVTFILIFLVVIVTVILIGKAVEKIFDLTHLGQVNKITGGIVSAAVLFFIYCQFIAVLNVGGALSPDMKKQSKLYSSVEKISPVMMDGVSCAIPFAKDFLSELQGYCGQLNHTNSPHS